MLKKPLYKWNLGLLNELLELKFSITLIKLFSSFFLQKIRSRLIANAAVPQSSVLSPTLYSIYINDTPQTQDVSLALFADETCIYATDRKEGYVH
jgi:hypothetical protein